MFKTSNRIMYLRQSYPTVIDPKTGLTKTIQGNPVGCLAIRVKRERIGNFLTNWLRLKSATRTTVEYGVSVRHPSDKFSRRQARELATHRLNMEPVSFTVEEDLDRFEITSGVMDRVYKSGLPTRAVKAAKLWLDTNTEGK